MRFKPQLFVFWIALPLWRATPPAQIPQSTEVLLAQDCRNPDKGPTHKFQVSVAATPGQQEKGLSRRKDPLRPNEGMLFWFDPPRPQAVFWMKETWIPLTLVYFDWDGKFLAQHSLQVERDPQSPKRLYPSPAGGAAVGFALEVSPNQKFDPKIRLCLPKS